MTTKPTWRMNGTDLAKVFAAHFGYAGRTGGWIYDSNGRPVAHGWQAFAAQLTRRGWITVGQGVNWRRVDLSAGTRHAALLIAARKG